MRDTTWTGCSPPTTSCRVTTSSSLLPASPTVSCSRGFVTAVVAQPRTRSSCARSPARCDTSRATTSSPSCGRTPWSTSSDMPSTEFQFSELLPLGADQTPYRLLTTDGVRVVETAGRRFLEVDPEALRLLTETAMHDIAHLLRPGHLQQLARILDDPDASPNDRFVALDLLKNANIAAGGVLPMCQDTGTAIVSAKRGRHVLTDGRDEEHISRGVYDAYTTLNLRYSQLAPLTTWDEKNTNNNLPAQVEIYATGGDDYKFLFMAKGGGSANKSFLYQETKAVLNPARMASFLEEKIRALGTAACPPYHLAIVVGGTSAEFALKTAKYASAKYLDTLPTE